MIKKLYLNNCEKAIRKNQPQYDDVKIEEIMYGLEAIYILITKTFIVLGSAYFLGIFKETTLLMLFYAIVRAFGHGVHADNSIVCLLISLFLFLLSSYLIAHLFIPFNIKLFSYVIATFFIVIYAPADTEKKPLVNRKKRTTLKTITIILAFLYIFLSLYVNNNLLSNSLFFALMLESIMILPITYKVFHQKYANYKEYKTSI